MSDLHQYIIFYQYELGAAFLQDLNHSCGEMLTNPGIKYKDASSISLIPLTHFVIP